MKKIKIHFMLLFFAGLVFFMVLTLIFVHANFKANSIDNLSDYLKFTLNTIDIEELSSTTDKDSYVDNFSKGFTENIKITLIDENGVVLGDSLSEYETMSNQLQSEEVVEALESGYGEDIRYSDTYKGKSIYIAYPIGDYILRFSAPMSEITSLTFNTLPIIIISLLLIFAIVSIIINKFIKKITTSFDNLLISIKSSELEKDNIDTQKIILDELKPIKNYFNELSDEIYIVKENFKSINSDMQSTLDIMEIGFILIDFNYEITVINKKARSFLNLEDDILNQKIIYYYRDLQFVDGLNSLDISKKELYLDIKNDEITVRFSMNYAENMGYVLLLSDVTEIVRLEKIRNDFVANVSHELKTPLTSISGFSELITTGIVDDNEKIISYNQKILKESRRLVRVVDELLKLSYIENSYEESNKNDFEKINLKEIFENIFDVLFFQIKEKNISYTIDGDLEILAQREMIYELVFNLVENAIKYNKTNGEILVTLFSNNNICGFKLKDSGIGIEEKEQQRIFERFYRVDKGRSRKTGGTGLGLSIAKHIVSLYNGEINVTSDGTGSEFQVVFGISYDVNYTSNNMNL